MIKFLRLAFASLLVLFPAFCFAGGPFGGTVRSMVFEGDGSPSICATDRGLFKFNDGKWSREEALGAQPFANVVKCGNRIIALQTMKGLVFNEKGAKTWSPMAQGVKGARGRAVDDINDLVASRENSSTLYLATAGKGILTSADCGNTWTLLENGMEKFNNSAHHVTAVLPQLGSRPTLIGTDGEGVLAYRDNAWVRAGDTLPKGVKVIALAENPSDPSHIALATRNNGLWESKDAAKSWKLLRQGEFGLVTAVAFNKNSVLIAYFAEDGLVQIKDGVPSAPLKSRYAVVRKLYPRKAGGWYAAFVDDGILELDENAKEIGYLNQGLDATSITALALDNSSPALWCGDSNGVFFQNTAAGDWEDRSAGLGIVPTNALVWQGENLYAGLGGLGLWLWDGQKKAWLDRSKPMGTANTVRNLALSAEGKIYAGTEGGVLWTAEGGMKWIQASAGLPSSPFWYLAADDENPKKLWAAGDFGLYQTENGGEKWQKLEDGNFFAVEYKDKTLWLISKDKLFKRQDSKLSEVFTAPRGEMLQCLSVTSAGIFLGSNGGLWLKTKDSAKNLWDKAGVLSLLYDKKNKKVFVGTDGMGVKSLKLE